MSFRVAHSSTKSREGQKTVSDNAIRVHTKMALFPEEFGAVGLYATVGRRLTEAKLVAASA